MRSAAFAAMAVGMLGASAFADDPTANLNPVAAVPLSSLSATRDRPLFAPTRRPPPPPPQVAAAPPLAAAIAAPPPSEPSFRLVGTLIGPAARVAIVTGDSDPPLRLREGETASGWTLREISPRAATFEGYGRSVTLDLHADDARPDGKALAAKAQSND